MSKADYALLQDVITDADFPDLDLALRRGRHIDRDDAAWYALLSDAQELLEPFYRRYGCELIHKTDGYFYLLPTGDKISRRQLSASDMLVGQALALLFLDPAAVERGGLVTHDELIAQLSTVLGTDNLLAAFNPGKRKRFDERVAQRNVRTRVAEAVRRLANMGFVDVVEGERVRLRSALMRFAEPVRGLSEPAEALAKLVAQGEVALTPEEPGLQGEGASEDEGGQDEGEREDDGLEEAGPAFAAGECGQVPDGSDDNDQPLDERALPSQEHLVTEASSCQAPDDAVRHDPSAAVQVDGALTQQVQVGEEQPARVDESAGEATTACEDQQSAVHPRPPAESSVGAQARVATDRDLDWADIVLPQGADSEDAG